MTRPSQVPGVHKCGARFTGKQEHCPQCCQTFSSTDSGDEHRVGDFNDGTRRCLTPAEMTARGLRLSDRGVWLPRLSPAELARLAEKRTPGTRNEAVAS